MKSYGLLFLLVAIALSHGVYAQKTVSPESDTIKWSYGRIDNRIRSESLSITGHLISYGGKGFLWVQNGSDHDYRFDVKGVKGSWSNADNRGELVYQAECEGIDGTITISGQGKNIVIQLDFRKPDKLTPNIDLKITSYNKL